MVAPSVCNASRNGLRETLDPLGRRELLSVCLTGAIEAQGNSDRIFKLFREGASRCGGIGLNSRQQMLGDVVFPRFLGVILDYFVNDDLLDCESGCLLALGMLL